MRERERVKERELKKLKEAAESPLVSPLTLEDLHIDSTTLQPETAAFTELHLATELSILKVLADKSGTKTTAWIDWGIIDLSSRWSWSRGHAHGFTVLSHSTKFNHFGVRAKAQWAILAHLVSHILNLSRG